MYRIVSYRIVSQISRKTDGSEECLSRLKSTNISNNIELFLFLDSRKLESDKLTDNRKEF